MISDGFGLKLTPDQERIIAAMEDDEPIALVPSQRPRECEYRRRSAYLGQGRVEDGP